MLKKIKYVSSALILNLALLLSPSGAGLSTVVMACAPVPGGGGGGGGWGYVSRPGGIALNRAATFLTDMSDVKGAYFDQATNRIVFVGTKLAVNQTPIFNKDDLAVAIRSVVFNNVNPSVNIGDPNNPTSTTQPVNFTGGIENTHMGYVMEKADYDLKKYDFGFQPNGSKTTSVVPGYQSATDRYLAQNPNLNDPNEVGMGRIYISPQNITVKADTTANSFVFDQVKMQVQSEIVAGSSTKFTAAHQASAQHLTDNYDLYAQENSWFSQLKDLSKIVGVVKWVKDNNLLTDYTWAKNYVPVNTPTPTSEQFYWSGPIPYGGSNVTTFGGVQYNTPNTYTTDNGTSSTLKSNSQSAAPSATSDHWDFTQGGQTYNSVAVSANAFRAAGTYDTTTADFSIDTVGSNNLQFSRHYNTLANTTGEIGNGWDYMPARLSAINKNVIVYYSGANYTGFYQYKLAFSKSDGTYETFTFNLNTGEYQPDKAEYNDTVFRRGNGDYAVLQLDNNLFTFKNAVLVDDFKLLKWQDNASDDITYNYGSSGTSPYVTSITDPQSRSITINRNTSGKITSTSDWSGRTVSYGYDANGNLITVTDPRNNIITYTYDSSGNLASIKNRQNQTVLTNTYNSNNKIQTSTDASSLTTTYTYDEANKSISSSDSNLRTHKTNYDTNMRITKQTDTLNNYTEYTYGTAFAVPTIEKDKNGNTTTRSLDAWGRELSTTLPDSSVITKSYEDEGGWGYVDHIHDGRYGTSGKDIYYTYDDNGWLANINDDGINTTYTNDASGSKLTITDGANHTTTNTYDNFGHVLTSTSPTSGVTTNTYDSLGRLTQIKDPSNNITSMTYDANSNQLTKTDSNGALTSTFDADNQLVSIKAPDNNMVQYTYNASGAQTTTKDQLLNLTSYGYDNYNNLTSKQDALNHTTQYQYDVLNRKKQSTSPLGKVANWEYDANGNLTKRTDESNRDITYQYDSLNRLLQTTYPDTTTIVNAYDARGNLTHIVSASGSTSYTYDSHDRLISETDPNNQVISYTYDNASNLLTTTYPDNKVVTNSYDSSNRLLTTSDWNSQQTSYQYNPNGTLLTKTFPNGIVGTYGYDQTNRVASIAYTKNSQPLTRYDYTRDVNGRVLSEVESQTTSGPGASFTVYGDSLATGWSTSNSFNSTINTSDTPAYEGSNALSFIPLSYYGNVDIRKAAGMSSTGYTTVSFAAKASQPGQKMTLLLKGTAATGSTFKELDISIYGGAVSSSGYVIYNVPLSALGGVGALIKAFDFTNATSNLQKFYIDNLKLTNNQQSDAKIYDDLFNGDYTAFSYGGSSNNSADTTNPRSGTKAIGVVLGTYGGIDLSPGTATLTTGYQSVTFAVAGSAANQDLTVRAIAANSLGTGTKIHLNTIGGNPPVGSYKVYTIPISSLTITNNKFWGIEIENATGVAQPKILIDDVSLVAAPTNIANSTSAYVYDANGRVTSATLPSNKSDSYTYDAVGNRINSTENGVSTNQAYNNDDQLTSRGARSFTYDNQGNQVTDGTKTLAYDFDNKLKLWSNSSPSATESFTYDGAGTRIGKTGGGTTHQFANSTVGENAKVLVDKNTTASTQSYQIYGDTLLSQGGAVASSRQYFLTDAMGNSRYVTDSTGSTVQAYNYDPFGNENLGGTVTNYAQQQYQKDRETGLTYLNARYYDPSTGRFISADYLLGNKLDSRSQNRYAYSANDPINLSDPSGLSYINGGISGTFLFVSVSGGIYVNDNGRIYPYAGVGLAAPGIGPGGSITYSNSNLSTGDSVNQSVGALGGGVSVDNNGNVESGVMTPGGSIYMQHTWNPYGCQ